VGAQVTVANRTLARGQALADRIGARAVRLSALDAALAEGRHRDRVRRVPNPC
jgi:glutamyl-tRNA reductase